MNIQKMQSNRSIIHVSSIRKIKILKDVDKERRIRKWIRYVDEILIVWEGEVNEFKKFTEELNLSLIHI